jgi:hypothetical protein
MRATILALGLAALAAASDVHDLKKDTFKDFIKENDLVLAECAYPSLSLLLLLLQLLRKRFGLALTVIHSLCAMVRPLQSARSRV